MGEVTNGSDEIAVVLAAGQAASMRGDWTAAKAAFQSVLDREESAEGLAGLGNVMWWLGETEASIDCSQRAYAVFSRRPDPVQAVFAAISLYFVYRISLGNRAAASGWQSRAARLVEEFSLAPLEGWVLLTRAHDSDDPALSTRLARKARDFARRFSDPDLELCALSQLGAALIEMGEVEEGATMLDEAMAAALAGESNNPNTVVYTSCNMISSCSQAAQVERAVQWIRAADDFTRHYGCPHLYTICRTYYGKLLFSIGKWDDAERELRAALAIGKAAERAIYGEALACLAELRLAQGRIDEAAQLLTGFEDHSSAARALAATHLAQGEPEVAAALAARLLRQRERASGPYLAGESIGLQQGILLEILAEAELQRGNADDAVSAASRLLQLGENLHSDPIVARGAHALGRALGAEGDRTDAVPLLERALDLFSRLGMPFEAARVRLLLAMSMAASQRDLAVAETRLALSTFETLGAGFHADQAASFLRTLGVKAARVGPKRFGVLSKREREILELLAEGATNRQIAARLFLSPKTVEHHVRSVLAKLELSNRAEAAAYAVRNPVPNSATN